MGYDLTIGEAYIEKPDCKYDYKFRVGVNRFDCEDAPTFRGDSMTGKSSSRSPSYSTWSDFCKETGLYDMFFDKEKGLIAHHPGTFMLHPNHAYQITIALNLYKLQHPNAKPGWCDCPVCDKFIRDELRESIEHEELDNTLARLIWLDFWVKKAITTCKLPALRNT
jgi:hypothetical protein